MLTKAFFNTSFKLRVFHGEDAQTWWRHQMEIFSALLAICAWNSPVTGEFPAQRPAFFDLRLNKRLSKQSWGWWFETPSHPSWRCSNEISCQLNGELWDNPGEISVMFFCLSSQIFTRGNGKTDVKCQYAPMQKYRGQIIKIFLQDRTYNSSHTGVCLIYHSV